MSILVKRPGRLRNFCAHPRVEPLLEKLENGVNTGAHTMLVSGPFSIGKTTLAVELVKQRLCPDDCGGQPHCTHCPLIDRNQHPDYTLIDDATITIDIVRSLRATLQSTAFSRNGRCAILRNVDSMTVDAANALLKSIEEPSQKTMIILTARNPYRLPSTLRSRVIHLRLPPVPEPVLGHWAVKMLQCTVSESIVRAAHGCPGLLVRLRDRSTTAHQRNQLIALLERQPHPPSTIEAMRTLDSIESARLIDEWLEDRMRRILDTGGIAPAEICHLQRLMNAQQALTRHQSFPTILSYVFSSAANNP